MVEIGFYMVVIISKKGSADGYSGQPGPRWFRL
jgi:hypothetical protein